MRSRLLFPLLLLGACASPYVYQPDTNATATVEGRRAADYQLPSVQAPRGDLRVASFGVAKIKANDESKGEVHALHVRQVLSNESDHAWQLDTHRQLVVLHDGTQLAPAYVRSDNGALPVVTAPPGAKRTIDLFYPLPVAKEKESRIPEFDVIWSVDTGGGQLVAQRTPFQRLRIDPYYAAGWGYSGAFGWGPYAWSDPFWGPGFIGPPGWYW